MAWKIALVLWNLFWASLPEPDPRVGDIYRFPPADVVKGAREANREYRRYCAERADMELHRRDHWLDVVRECDVLYTAWDELDSAQNVLLVQAPTEYDFDHEALCVYYLSRLRNVIGRENFFQGRLPPHLPVRHFVELP